MRRLSSLALFGLVVCLTPSAAEAAYQYPYSVSQDVFYGETLPQEVERNFKAFSEMASSMAGAPKGGRALEAENPARFDPPSAFERRNRKESLSAIHPSDSPMIRNGSGRYIDRYSPPPATESPFNTYQGYVAQTRPPAEYSSTPSAGIFYRRSPNSYYEESRPAARNRRELTVYEKNVIYNQPSKYAVIDPDVE
jgi:hypothetical protein